ncbi:MAG: hypothetical protein JSS51_10185 [Planctomycetes bacterium]|nr:hypothetical protein [Planctomycetota bacterium]
MRVPLVAIGPDLTPVLERCVQGTVVSGGERRRTEVVPLRRCAEVADPNAGLRRLLTAARAIHLGRTLCDEQLHIAKIDAKRPLTELAAEHGLTLNEARMRIRLFIASERGHISAGATLSDAERQAGIRDTFDNVISEFR